MGKPIVVFRYYASCCVYSPICCSGSNWAPSQSTKLIRTEHCQVSEISEIVMAFTVDIYTADFLSERSFGKQNHSVQSSSDLANKLQVQFSQGRIVKIQVQLLKKNRWNGRSRFGPLPFRYHKDISSILAPFHTHRKNRWESDVLSERSEEVRCH